MTNGSKSSPSTPISTDFRAVRGRAYALRTASRRMVGDLHDSLACCGYVHEAFRPYGRACEGMPDLATLVVREDGRAAFTGTTRCGSPWACPVCAPRIAAARAQTLMPQIVDMMADGWSAWLVTLTVRHARGDSLADLWKVLGKAWGRVTSGKRWAALKKNGGLEYVRGYDVTHSEANGWHPHIHISLYLSPEHKNPREVTRWFLNRWMEVLSKMGWDALQGAQHIVKANNPEAAAKYAVTPAACYETVAMALKRSRTGKSGSTPFEILESASAGNKRAYHLWREYVSATKGRKQVVTSKGLHLKEDAEDVEERIGQPIADIGTSAMIELDRRRLSAPLLDAVEKAAPEDRYDAALSILRLLEFGGWGLCKPWNPPEEDTKPPTIIRTPGKTERERRQYTQYQEWKTELNNRSLFDPKRSDGENLRDVPCPDTI